MNTYKLLTNPVHYVKTQFLFAACKAGNIEAVKKAVKNGADINALKCAGKYNDGISGDVERDGHFYVTPLVVAAMSMNNKKEAKNYQEIIQFLMAQPKLDLSRVAACHYDEYFRNTKREWVFDGKNEKKVSIQSLLKSPMLQQQYRISKEAAACLSSSVLKETALLQKQFQQNQMAG